MSLERRINQRGGIKIAFPPGYFKHRESFFPEGIYGKWLLQHQIVKVWNNHIFLHGGLSPDYGHIACEDLSSRIISDIHKYFNIVSTLEGMNLFHRMFAMFDLDEFFTAVAKEYKKDWNPEFKRKIETLLSDWIEIRKGPMMDPEGPQWYRGLASEEVSMAELDSILQFHKSKRIIIGHTPQPGFHIVAKYGDKVICIDTGMSQFYFKGHAEALEIKDDDSLETHSVESESVHEGVRFEYLSLF